MESTEQRGGISHKGTGITNPAPISHEPGIFLVASTEESSLQTLPVPSVGLLGLTPQHAIDQGGLNRG